GPGDRCRRGPAGCPRVPRPGRRVRPPGGGGDRLGPSPAHLARRGPSRADRPPPRRSRTVVAEPGRTGPARAGGPRPGFPLARSPRTGPPGSRPPDRRRGPPPAGRLVRRGQVDAGLVAGRVARARLGALAPARARPGDGRLRRLAAPGRARAPVPREPRA